MRNPLLIRLIRLDDHLSHRIAAFHQFSFRKSDRRVTPSRLCVAFLGGAAI
jgi:hypothetical protein